MHAYQVNSTDYAGAIVIERNAGNGWGVPAYYEMGGAFALLEGPRGDCTFPTIEAAQEALARFMKEEA